MPVHEIGLFSTLVVSLVAAFIGGLLARSIRLPPLLGYLAAGVLIGPFTPGFEANQDMANELAEVGVALLLFNIGLHFSFKDLLTVQKIVIPGALAQIFLTTLLGSVGAYYLLDLSVLTSIVIGLAMSIASTAVATRVLDERRQLTSLAGRVALGWLVVQDIIVIMALVILPVMNVGLEQQNWYQTLAVLGQKIFQIAGFVAVMVIGGRRVIPWFLGYVARTNSRELFVLAVIVFALGIAYGSAILFGVSLALGAFFAGIVIGESDLNYHAASEALSIQQIFTILFFVSVGMLFDPRTIPNLFWEILSFLGVIIVGMGVLTFAILMSLRVPLKPSALVGSAFAQIGEFSFVLAELGFQDGFLSMKEKDLIVAVALLSIMINPFILFLTTRAVHWFSLTSLYARLQSDQMDDTNPQNVAFVNHTILVGHGRVGSIVASALREQGLHSVTIESNRTLTEQLRGDGWHVIFGDASREKVLAAAHPDTAKLIIIAVPDPYTTKQIIRLVKKNYPNLAIVVRTHSDEEAKDLTTIGVGLAVMGEREIAFGITFFALQTLGFGVDQSRSTVAQLRKDIYSLDQEALTT